MSRCAESSQAHTVPETILDKLLEESETCEEGFAQVVQALKSRNEAAAEVTDREQQLHKIQQSILEFHEAKVAKKSFDCLGEKGFTIVPLFGSENREERVEFMTKALEKAYLEGGEGGRLVVTPETDNLWRIRSQRRYMIHFDEKMHRKKVGEKFMTYASEATQTMADVLQALNYGHERKVHIEKLTGLKSPEGEANQDLHTDQDREKVRKKRMGTEKQTRSANFNGVPAPFSCILALRETVYLHVIKGSHWGDQVDDFDWGKAREIEIPPGYGVLFHGCLAHAGSSYSVVNCRLHVYLKCSSDTSSANNEIKWLNAAGTKPAARVYSLKLCSSLMSKM